MSSLLPEDTARWYANKVRAYGFDHRGLGFGNKSSQEKRFEALLPLGDFDGARILDAGCGFGDFLAFLHARGIVPEYTGLDICEPMIERCRERFDGGEARFLAGDVLQFEPDEPYDYVVASGLFGLDSVGARERIRPTMERLFAWSRLGAAMNFLSTSSPRPAEARIYVEPWKALEAGLGLTPSARVDHTYLPNDFTLFLYKTPAWKEDPRKP
ncbi:MAG: class I SAM-dependent methyltransferase [Usitatibacter sp.]